MFKDLQKLIAQQEQEQPAARKQQLLFDRLRNKPFWIWNEEEHNKEYARTAGRCCFNHIIGLPQKDGVDKPLYDYEQIIFDCLADMNGSANKLLWIKKATGLGVSEFMLRFMAWLCLKDDTYKGTQMPIVCGPNIDIAIKLIKRIRNLFEPFGIFFDTKEIVIELNGCVIEAFPSNHLDAYRSLERPKFIFLDEADFFRPSDQQDARDVSERYIAKSNPYIVMVSTPNAPEGLFERIEKEPEGACLYKRLFLDYTYGIGKIYTAEEIEQAKRSPSFEREYNLKYLGRIGNVFHTKDIEAAIVKGRLYNPDTYNPMLSSFASTSMGIDPGYGSSAFGVVVTQWADDHIQILHAEEYHRPDYNEMISVVYGLMSRYQVDKCYIDGANPSFIRSLKLEIGEDPNYIEQIERMKKEGFGGDGLQNMKAVPVSFAKEHKAMLGHCKMILEETDPRRIAINPAFDKLIVALRTAVDKDGTLDKESTSYNDILDAFRLALKFYQFQERID